jgi:site-specific DNA recombinase
VIIDVYLRVSKKRKSDDRYASLESQEAVCRRRVRDSGAELGAVHRDPGLSAWNPDTVRPGWDAMWERLRSGACDGVCVFDVERFSRQPLDGELLIKMAGRGRIVLDADSEMDLSTPSGKKNFREAMSAAAYYSDRLSTRLTREGNGKELRALAGIPNVAARPFGFEPGGVVVHAGEADAIRACVRLLLAGEPLDRLISELEGRGLLTAYGKRWTRSGVRRMLERPRNAGLIVYRGRVLPDVALSGDPILSRPVYDQLTAKIRGRPPQRPPSERYLLTGIAECGTCGRGLSGRPRPHHRAYPDGSLRREYWCGNRECTWKIAIDVVWLDGFVLDRAVADLSDPARADLSDKAAQEAERARARILDEVAGIEDTLVEVGSRVGHQEMSLREADAIGRPLRSRRDALRDQLRVLEDSRAAAVPVGPGIAMTPRQAARGDWIAVAMNGTTAEKRGMVTRALGDRRLVIGPGTPSKFDAGRVTIA